MNVLANGLNISVPFVSFLSRSYYAKRCEKLRTIKKYLVGEGSTFEEEMVARDKIAKIWQDNQDIFEGFYQENESLYEEMTENLARVRTIMKPKRISTYSRTEL